MKQYKTLPFYGKDIKTVSHSDKIEQFRLMPIFAGMDNKSNKMRLVGHYEVKPTWTLDYTLIGETKSNRVIYN